MSLTLKAKFIGSNAQVFKWLPLNQEHQHLRDLQEYWYFVHFQEPGLPKNLKNI